MSRIVVITTTYLRRPYANGVCAQHLVQALRKAGHFVNIVCFYDDYIPDHEKGLVYMVQHPQMREANASNWFKKTRKIAKALFKPTFNNSLIEDYYSNTVQCIEENQSDAVVAMFFPLEGFEVLRRIKKAKPSIKTIVYELDSIGDGVVDHSFLQSIINRSFERWQNNSYKLVDGVIVMRSHKQYWEKTFGKNHSARLLIADIPVLTQPPQKERILHESVYLPCHAPRVLAYPAPDQVLPQGV